MERHADIERGDDPAPQPVVGPLQVLAPDGAPRLQIGEQVPFLQPGGVPGGQRLAPLFEPLPLLGARVVLRAQGCGGRLVIDRRRKPRQVGLPLRDVGEGLLGGVELGAGGVLVAVAGDLAGDEVPIHPNLDV